MPEEELKREAAEMEQVVRGGTMVAGGVTATWSVMAEDAGPPCLGIAMPGSPAVATAASQQGWARLHPRTMGLEVAWE